MNSIAILSLGVPLVHHQAVGHGSGDGWPHPGRTGSIKELRITNSNTAIRCPLIWADGIAELVQVTDRHRVDLRLTSQHHTVILHDRGARYTGETSLGGVPSSTLRDFSKRLTFVPAGHDYHEWFEARSSVRMICYQFSPMKCAAAELLQGSLTPRLFFEDASLLESMRKLQAILEMPSARDADYLNALAMMIIHEVAQSGEGGKPADFQQGGLASWQQRLVAQHIDDHLDQTIRLETLAGMARLSTYHFCRAFKQSFGVPPLRYHASRRIERAKDLLAEREQSITDIGLTLGYCDTSSFAAAFRKVTGVTPTAYRRQIG